MPGRYSQPVYERARSAFSRVPAVCFKVIRNKVPQLVSRERRFRLIVVFCVDCGCD